MTQRNDAELASVLRKIIEDGDVTLNMQDDAYAFDVGDVWRGVQVFVTEAESQALSETIMQFDNRE